jgi:N-acyl homoserine lactone hydrolase
MTTPTGTPQRLYLINVAMLGDAPMPCYLIQTSTGVNILVDTGVPDDPHVLADWPSAVLGLNVVEQLALIELQPSDITLVIATHFDFDHVGYHPAFAHAEFIVQRSHYAVAQNDARYSGTRARWNHPAVRYRQVEGDLELLPGLELVVTDGHVVGHQSVLVRLPATGPVLLVIDAVSKDDFDADAPGATEAERRSALKLRELAQRENAVMIIFGHNAQQWQTLKKLPEYYE